MLAYFYLISATVVSTVISIMSATFSRRNRTKSNISSIYNVLVTLSAASVWGIFYFSDFTFDPKVILYSLGYGVFYIIAMSGLYKALASGSVSLTAFVKQLSLIAVAIWGFLFWNAAIETTVVIGLVLIVAALYLCFKPDKDTHTKPLTFKWVIFASMLLVGNAGCSIIQKMQQTEFEGSHGNMLMFFGCFSSVLFCTAKFIRGPRCKIAELDKRSLLCPVFGGISSALLGKCFILLINSPMSESVFFPCIAVGGLILTTVYSFVVYRERLRVHQWIGLAVGAVALVFLNI